MLDPKKLVGRDIGVFSGIKGYGDSLHRLVCRDGKQFDLAYR